MQINIRTARVGGGAYTTVANDAAGDWVDWKSPVFRTVEFAPEAYGAAGKPVINMGNGMWTVNIPIRKFYGTSILARQAIATIGALFGAGNLDVQVFEVAAADATYFPNCSVGEFAPDAQDGQRGVAVFFTLRVNGPVYTTVAP